MFGPDLAKRSPHLAQLATPDPSPRGSPWHLDMAIIPTTGDITSVATATSTCKWNIRMNSDEASWCLLHFVFAVWNDECV